MKIAGTGHRSEDCEDEAVVRQRIRRALDSLPVGEKHIVIAGMANGFDLWLADEALDRGIEVWAAKPWTGHRPRVDDESLYARVLTEASKVVNVVESDEYPGPWAYHRRNEWMVDQSTHVLAYWSGKKRGGTFACITYANKVGKPFRNCYDE